MRHKKYKSTKVVSTRLKPGLHIVVTIAEHASDDVSKKILKLSTYQLQIFFVKYKYLRSLQPCEDKSYGVILALKDASM